MAVKSETCETRRKSQSKVLAGVGNGAADFAAQQGSGRGRPRVEDKGQVVSCRLPAEELHAFDALCSQLGAKSRSDGVRSVAFFHPRTAGGILTELVPVRASLTDGVATVHRHGSVVHRHD